MKITHTTEFFFPNEGGVERHIYYLAKELFSRPQPYHISVIASDREHHGQKITPLRTNFEGIEVYREPSLLQKHFWNYFPYMKKTLQEKFQFNYLIYLFH